MVPDWFTFLASLPNARKILTDAQEDSENWAGDSPAFVLQLELPGFLNYIHLRKFRNNPSLSSDFWEFRGNALLIVSLDPDTDRFILYYVTGHGSYHSQKVHKVENTFVSFYEALSQDILDNFRQQPKLRANI